MEPLVTTFEAKRAPLRGRRLVAAGVHGGHGGIRDIGHRAVADGDNAACADGLAGVGALRHHAHIAGGVQREGVVRPSCWTGCV